MIAKELPIEPQWRRAVFIDLWEIGMRQACSSSPQSLAVFGIN